MLIYIYRNPPDQQSGVTSAAIKNSAICAINKYSDANKGFPHPASIKHMLTTVIVPIKVLYCNKKTGKAGLNKNQFKIKIVPFKYAANISHATYGHTKNDAPRLIGLNAIAIQNATPTNATTQIIAQPTICRPKNR